MLAFQVLRYDGSQPEVFPVLCRVHLAFVLESKITNANTLDAHVHIHAHTHTQVCTYMHTQDNTQEQIL